jgi:hypothetical protein
MKNIYGCLIISLLSINMYAQISKDVVTEEVTLSSHYSPRTELPEQDSNGQYSDEYYGQSDDDAEEYEKYVCDQAKPQKISRLMALLTRVGGDIFIRCIVAKEFACYYFSQMKQIVCKWLSLN